MKVRIAVLVAPDGTYQAGGWGNGKDGEHVRKCPPDLYDYMTTEPQAVYWITADVPLPAAQEIEGKVEA